jgi:Zyg-11 family protein
MYKKDIIAMIALSHLKSLNVTHSTFMNSTNFIVVISLTKLQNLQSLNVSHTEFNNHGLEIIATDLPLELII